MCATEHRRGAAVAAAGTALSRVTGLVRLAATTFALGVTESRLADTYNLANTTPTMIHELIIGGILSSVLLRSYIEVKTKDGDEEGLVFIRRVTNATLLVLGAATLLLVLAAPLIFRLYSLRVSGPDRQAQQVVGTLLLQLFAPQIVFYGLSYISTALLNAHRRFGMPMFAPVLNNLAVSATLVGFALTVPTSTRTIELIPATGILLLGIGTTAGVALQGIAPFLYLRRIRIRLPRRAGVRDARFRRLLFMSSFMAGYVVTNMVGLWIALFLANQVQGGTSAYQYAFVFFQLPHGLLAVSIVTAIFPSLTERAVQDDTRGFARELANALRGVAFFIIPAAAGYVAIAPQLVALLLEHGITTAASTELIAIVLRTWAPGIFFFSTFYVLLRAFYALGDTRTPMMINLVGLAVNVALDVAAFTFVDDPQLRIAGLAAGHGASYMVASALAIRAIRRRVGPAATEGWAQVVGKIAAASALTGFGAWGAGRIFGTFFGVSSVPMLLAQVVVATATGLLIYAGSAKALRLEEMQWIYTIARRRR